MIDFHSHILPGMDDGSSSPKESLIMLRMAAASDTETIVATPHFLRRTEDIESFLSRRADSYRELTDAAGDGRDLPSVVLGAEVEFYLGISREKQLERLCIDNNGHLLLEMPFREWSSITLNEVRALSYGLGIIPIIAHVERYFQYPNAMEFVYNLVELGAVLQTNAEAVTNRNTRRKVLHMIKMDMIQLLGSDCHDTKCRPPGLKEACRIIEKKLGQNAVDAIYHHSDSILCGTGRQKER